jgi:hypothetical protein
MYWLLAHQMQPDETYEFPLQAIKMLEGAGVVFKKNSMLLTRQGYGWIGDEALPAISLEDRLSIAAQVQLRSIEEDLTYLLDAFDLPAMSDGLQSIYNEAKHYVLHHYRAFFSGADTKTLQRFVGFMATRCQPGYLSLLKQHDPLAMALMARMLVMLSELDHAWWINGKGDYEATERDVRGIRELMPTNLRWVMDWPCSILDKEIILNRG